MADPISLILLATTVSGVATAVGAVSTYLSGALSKKDDEVKIKMPDGSELTLNPMSTPADIRAAEHAIEVAVKSASS